jgi:hypothetical protein
VFGWLIAVKTWHAIAHVEVYVGRDRVVASRDGEGVGLYPLRTAQLYGIYRPTAWSDASNRQAFQWFILEAEGQGYDWLGLLRFTWRSDYSRGNTNNKQFCSEFATRFYRRGGLDPFPGEDADAVPPFYFSISPLFTRIWGA